MWGLLQVFALAIRHEPDPSFGSFLLEDLRLLKAICVSDPSHPTSDARRCPRLNYKTWKCTDHGLLVASES